MAKISKLPSFALGAPRVLATTRDSVVGWNGWIHSTQGIVAFAEVLDTEPSTRLLAWRFDQNGVASALQLPPDAATISARFYPWTGDRGIALGRDAGNPSNLRAWVVTVENACLRFRPLLMTGVPSDSALTVTVLAEGTFVAVAQHEHDPEAHLITIDTSERARPERFEWPASVMPSGWLWEHTLTTDPAGALCSLIRTEGYVIEAVRWTGSAPNGTVERWSPRIPKKHWISAPQIARGPSQTFALWRRSNEKVKRETRDRFVEAMTVDPSGRPSGKPVRVMTDREVSACTILPHAGVGAIVVWQSGFSKKSLKTYSVVVRAPGDVTEPVELGWTCPQMLVPVGSGVLGLAAAQSGRSDEWQLLAGFVQRA